MKVSIIIPCYRQGRYLATAIESCLAQTHRNTELIVVNDGSDDDTDEVATRYKDSITYIAKKNGGVSSARNAGIAAATGRYMKFLDADDYLASTQVEWQMEALGGRQDRVSMTTLRAYEDEHPERYRDIVPTFRQLLPELLNDHDGAPHACLYPSELVRAVGGFVEQYVNTQDWDFICRIGKLRPQVHCDRRVGGYYRLHPGSLSTYKRTFTIEVARQLIALHDEFRDGPNRDWFGSELLGAEQRTYRRMLLAGYRDPELERELLQRIRELWPVAGPPSGTTRKFRALRGLLGYPLAERVYVKYLRRRLSRS